MISFATWMTMAHMGHRRTQRSKMPGLRLKEVKRQNICSHIWRKIGHFKRDLCGKHNKKQTTWDCSFCWKKTILQIWFDVYFPCFCKIWCHENPSMVMVMIWKKKKHPFRHLNPERRRGPAHRFPGKRLTERLTSLNKKKMLECLVKSFWSQFHHIGWKILGIWYVWLFDTLYFKCLFWFDMFLFDFVWPCFFILFNMFSFDMLFFWLETWFLEFKKINVCRTQELIRLDLLRIF